MKQCWKCPGKTVPLRAKIELTCCVRKRNLYQAFCLRAIHAGARYSKSCRYSEPPGRYPLRYLTVLSVLLVSTGLAAATTAALSYFTRYSMIDALYGEIDSTLYLRITAMTSFEKAAIVCGIAAVLVGIALALSRLIGACRSINA